MATRTGKFVIHSARIAGQQGWGRRGTTVGDLEKRGIAGIGRVVNDDHGGSAVGSHTCVGSTGEPSRQSGQGRRGGVQTSGSEEGRAKNKASEWVVVYGLLRLSVRVGGQVSRVQ